MADKCEKVTKTGCVYTCRVEKVEYCTQACEECNKSFSNSRLFLSTKTTEVQRK